ncbi:hypothetical protein ACP275_02G020500 [Erythranthe tilingii]
MRNAKLGFLSFRLVHVGYSSACAGKQPLEGSCGSFMHKGVHEILETKEIHILCPSNTASFLLRGLWLFFPHEIKWVFIKNKLKCAFYLPFFCIFNCLVLVNFDI